MWIPGGPNSRRPRVGVRRPVNSSGLEIILSIVSRYNVDIA